MEFTLNRTSALHVLQQALKTCNIKSKGSADSEFLFQERNGDLYVSSLNETAEQTILLPVDDLVANEKESFSVSGQAVTDCIRNFCEEEIKCSFATADKALKLVSLDGRINFGFPTGHPEEFIPFNYVPSGSNFTIKGSILSDALKQTAFCATTDYSLAPLTAIKVRIDGDKLTAESTDQLRISVYNIDIDDANVPPIEFLLPRDTANTLSSLLENVDVLEVKPGTRHVRLSWLDTTFTSSLENGIGKAFRALSPFLGGKEVGSVKISKGDLKDSIKMISQVAKDSYVSVSIIDKGLKIVASEQTGAAKLVLTTQAQTGFVEVKVACKFFQQAVESMTEPWIEICFREIAGATALITKENHYEHLVFPVAPNQTEPDDAEEDEAPDEE